MALVALTLSDGGFLLLVIGAAIGYTAIPLAMAASHRELVGAETCLWLQKPVREVGFVLTRFLETLVATAGLSLLFGGLCVGMAALAKWVPGEGDLLLTALAVRDPAGWVLLSTPAGALASCTVAAMAFGATAWLQRGGRAVVVLLIFFGLLASTRSSNLTNETAQWLDLSRVFPSREIFALTAALIGNRPFEAQFVTVPLGYSAAWVAVGIVGVWLSMKLGRIGYERGV
ncbi:MAG: hypothetical protein F4107_06730 [Gemmatimonadetes bacterium]|nr:hypothetical protein [Gemmatimonadota bacterium]MYI65618.1 hypothetical protein [Gemmatimonadota bacterium]